MSDNLMKRSAKQFQSRCFIKRDIKEHVKKILQEIELKIEDAHKCRLSQIGYYVQGNFNIPPLTNKQAQTKIWGTVIEQLQMNGYIVGFKTEGKKYKFVISWIEEQNNKDFKEKEQLIEDAFKRLSS